MTTYVIQRLMSAAITMLVVATVAFFIINIVPGDAASAILGEEATAAEVAEVRERLGLDRPWTIRLLEWYGGLVRGDLGTSYYHVQSVTSLIAQRIEPTAMLTLTATIIAAGIGIPLGVIAALRAGTPTDLLTMVISLIGVSIPGFWLGLLLMLLFSLQLGWLPTLGYRSVAEYGLLVTVEYLALPAIALGISNAAVIARMTRANLLDALHEDYVRTAHAKGLRASVVHVKHALRNAMVPTLGVIGVSIALMLGGSIIIETVFVIPGIGSLVVNSILRRDFPVIQGVIMAIALITALVNLGVDMLYGVLDPRIRYD